MYAAISSILEGTRCVEMHFVVDAYGCDVRHCHMISDESVQKKREADCFPW